VAVVIREAEVLSEVPQCRLLILIMSYWKWALRVLGCCVGRGGQYCCRMQLFFRNWKDLNIVLEQLPALQCPFCGAGGTLIRYGFNRGYITPVRRGIRAQRIRCKLSPRRKGCTVTFCLRPSSYLPRRCFRAKGLWAFIQQLRTGRSIKAAWENSGIPLSLDTGYRLYRRLALCQPILRTNLWSRAPPKKSGAGSALRQVFDHLIEVFGDECAVRAYQEALQRDFLAIA